MAVPGRKEALSDLQLPWCLAITQSPDWKPLGSRENTTNQLFGDTLWTAKTVRAHQSYYRKPPGGRSTGGELRTLLSLGSGLDGYPGICHGGFLALVFDDAIHELAAQEIPEKSITASLNITYRKPVRTPGVIVCRVWIEREPEGRKGWVKAAVEDGNGGVHATAEGFILKIRGKL